MEDAVCCVGELAIHKVKDSVGWFRVLDQCIGCGASNANKTHILKSKALTRQWHVMASCRTVAEMELLITTDSQGMFGRDKLLTMYTSVIVVVSTNWVVVSEQSPPIQIVKL